MEKAADLVRMSDLPIGRIATEVGLHHLGHFYRVFGTASAPPCTATASATGKWWTR